MTKIYHMILCNSDIMKILAIIKSLPLNDCWLCAGTLRNFVWNKLSGINETLTSDIDVVFFDKNISYEETVVLEQQLKDNYPQYDWELKNEFYMNTHSPNTPKYTSSKDAISKFPEKCTAVGARLDDRNQLELYLPYGEEEILNFIVSPTPYFEEDLLRYNVYLKRVDKKKWNNIWPHLTIIKK
ncbi:TPA: nucleotidyltransferase family protein [Streptococcus agalactiae]|nr:nucleotidyltransferase family protein [Streptococcus agalactiae]